MIRPIAICCALAVLWACGSDKKKTTTPTCPPVTAAPSCANTVQAPIPSLDGMVQDLGTLTVGTDATFDVTTGTGSFVVFSQEVGESAAPTVTVVDSNGCPVSIPNAVVPRTVTSPGGTLYYDDFVAFPTTTIQGKQYDDVSQMLAFDAGFQPVVGAFPVPNTSGGFADIDNRTSGQIEPGRWSFRFNDWAFECPFSGCSGGNNSGHYRVHVVTRPTIDPSHVSTLELEVYLATDPTSVLSSAAVAATHPQMTRWKQSLKSFLQDAGITLDLDKVRFHDLPDEVKRQHAPNGAVDVSGSGPCSNLNQLFTAATERTRAVHVFLADELLAPSGTNGQVRVAGVDGSIPGPSGFPGTIYGGAIVGLRDELGFESTANACSGQRDLTNCGTDRLAYFTAHEIGHWLGLYHTTEMDGTFFDPLSSTERCACFSCAPAPAPGRTMTNDKCAEVNQNPTTVVFNSICTSTTNPNCGGGRNLMFWLFDDAISTGELSDQQGRVMKLNPAVQ